MVTLMTPPGGGAPVMSRRRAASITLVCWTLLEGRRLPVYNHTDLAESGRILFWTVYLQNLEKKEREAKNIRRFVFYVKKSEM